MEGIFGLAGFEIRNASLSPYEGFRLVRQIDEMVADEARGNVVFSIGGGSGGGRKKRHVVKGRMGRNKASRNHRSPTQRSVG